MVNKRLMQLIGVLLLTSFLVGCRHSRKRVAAIHSDAYTNDSLAENYWNNFRLADSAECAAEADCCFAAYARLLHKLPYKKSEKAVTTLVKKLGNVPAPSYRIFLNLAEKYLYDPQSELCDDELYRPFLKDAVNHKGLDYATKERLRFRLEINGHNRPGYPATDFRYETADGKNGTLYGIRSKYVLVYFNNPDCHDCKVVCDSLKSNRHISRLVSCGVLKILSLYPDRDQAIWRKYAKYMPATWINAVDPSGEIKDNNIYDLKAIPTLYLLDRDKKVILKDPVLKKLINFFDNKD